MECCWREILEGTCLGTHDSSFTHSLFGAERSECALLVDCELFKQVVLLPSLEPEILKKAELKLPVNSLSCICDCQSVLVLNNHDGQRARLQHPGRPQEEDEGDQGGVWEVQGGGRRFAKKTRSGNQSERRCKLTNFEFFWREITDMQGVPNKF